MGYIEQLVKREQIELLEYGMDVSMFSIQASERRSTVMTHELHGSLGLRVFGFVFLLPLEP